MKLLVFFVAFVALAKADYTDVVLQKFEGRTFQIRENFAEEFLLLAKSTQQKLLTSGTSSEVNKYTDALLVFIGKFIVNNLMDPIQLPDFSEKLLPIGALYNLTDGWLQNTSTIGRFGDAVVEYSNDTKKFTLTIPLLFDALQLTYDYRVRVPYSFYPLIEGNVQGKIKDFRMKVILDFDFNTYEAHLTKLETTKTGTLTLEFSDNLLLEFIITPMRSALSVILHPIITKIMGSIVKLPLDYAVNLVNQIMQNHTTTVTSLLLAFMKMVKEFRKLVKSDKLDQETFTDQYSLCHKAHVCRYSCDFCAQYKDTIFQMKSYKDTANVITYSGPCTSPENFHNMNYCISKHFGVEYFNKN